MAFDGAGPPQPGRVDGPGRPRLAPVVGDLQVVGQVDVVPLGQSPGGTVTGSDVGPTAGPVVAVVSGG